MKNCPRCSKSPISFADWWRGADAFRWYCVNCGVPLKADSATWVGSSLIVAGMLVAPFAVGAWFDVEITRHGPMFYMIMSLCLLIGASTWLIAGYRVDDQAKPIDKLATK